MAAQSRAASQNQAGRPTVTETIVRTEAKIGRNDKVIIQNVMSGEQKTLKYKQAESLLKEGSWVITK
jgi:preprotein translocase subunit SecA